MLSKDITCVLATSTMSSTIKLARGCDVLSYLLPRVRNRSASVSCAATLFHPLSHRKALGRQRYSTSTYGLSMPTTRGFLIENFRSDKCCLAVCMHRCSTSKRRRRQTQCHLRSRCDQNNRSHLKAKPARTGDQQHEPKTS